MSSRPARFTQTDIKRLAIGIKSAGFEAVRIEIKPTGEIVAIGQKSGQAETNFNEWDEVLPDAQATQTIA